MAMRAKLIKHLKTFHRISLLAVVIIVVMHLLGTEIKLSQDIRLSSLILFFISGITLFWIGVITKGAYSKYYRFFIIAPTLLGMLLITIPFAGVLLLATIYKPFENNGIVKKVENIEMRNGSNFLGPCCKYEVYESKYNSIEKSLGYFYVDGHINTSTIQLSSTGPQLIIKLSYVHIHDSTLRTDTTFLFQK